MKITISQYINFFAGRWKWLDYLAIFFAKWLAYLLVAVLFVFACFERNMAIFFVPVISGIISRFTINELIYRIYKKKRPSSLATEKVLIKPPRTPSFPSSHASFFFTVSFLLFFYDIPLAIFFTICSCFVSFFRVFCGVHWLPDIFTGSFMGLISGFIAAATLGWNPDSNIFHFINNFAFRWERLDMLGIFFATRLEYLIWAILLIMVILYFKKYWRAAIVAVLAGGVSRFIFAEIIRFFLPRLRPFWDMTTKLLVDKDNASSFPSGHASFYFAISTVIYFYNKKAGMLMYILSFLVVLGRVFVGLHWPSDILAGAILGVFTGWLVNKLANKFINK